MEIDSALTAIQTLRSELQDAKLAAVNAQLKPLPGESVRDSGDSGFLRTHHKKWQLYWAQSSYSNYITVTASNSHLKQSLMDWHIKLLFYLLRLSLCFSWRSVLRIWAAPLSQWDPPWLSCSRVLHKEMNTTQVGTGDIFIEAAQPFLSCHHNTRLPVFK